MQLVLGEPPTGLRHPVLLAGFGGWGDAGSAASIALRHVLGDPAPSASAMIDPSACYDFTVARPLSTRSADGQQWSLEYPKVAFYPLRLPSAERDLLILLGPEPHFRWPELAPAIIRYARAAGVESHVRFAGVVPHAQVLEELHHADALVLSSVPTPTFEENQGCVLQEAMLCRLAIIASDTGGVPESVAPDMLEWLVPPGDPTAIAERIRRLSRVPVAALNTLGWVSRRFAESRYDARPLTRRLLREAFSSRP